MLAMLLGGVGFAFHPFWVGSLVVMAVLLGSMLSEHRGARRSVALDVVAAVVDEVRDAASPSN